MQPCKCLISSLLLLFCSFLSSAQENPKNIIIILADDLGWNDTSIYQDNQFYETPNIDDLASKGLVFDHAYSNSPLCSPTRASLLTGQTPARHGIYNPNISTPEVRLSPSLPAQSASNQLSVAPRTATRLNNQTPTLSSILKANQYQTAHFGKWHLGPPPYSPLEHGFDIDIPHYAGSGPEGGYLAPWRFAPKLQPQFPGEHIDERLAKEAVSWINKVKDAGPFYVNFWPFSVHAPFNASPDLVEEFKKKRTPFNSQRSAVYAAMVKHFDNAIGILWNGIVEAGLENDTIIIFTSDNGGNMYDVLGQIYPTGNFPLRGGKATQYAGGNRVPTFIIWPGLTQTNTLSHAPVQTVDLFPTILNNLNIPLPAGHEVDGNDITDILRGDNDINNPVITYYPTQPKIPDWLPPSATVQLGNWKLINTFHYGVGGGDLLQLYDLSNDFGESNNLAEQEPEKLGELLQIMNDHLGQANAIIPKKNPAYKEGTFERYKLGVPDEKFQIPEDRMPQQIQFNLSGSKAVVSEGENVRISWTLINNTNDSNIQYRQFMGPDVSIQAEENSFSFVVPKTYTPQYIAFAFIVRDGNQVIRQQIAVKVLPSDSSPELVVTPVSATVRKGGTANFKIQLTDKNKQRLSLRVSSDDIALDNTLDANQENFELTIPSDYKGDELTVRFTANDETNSSSADVAIKLKSQQPNPSEGDDEEGSGGGASWIFILAGVEIYRRHFRKTKRGGYPELSEA